jgi:3-deoxy-7-phosphoheptulonate synthase
MILVTVDKGADREAVRRELVGRGLWVTAVQQHFLVEAHSAAVDPAELDRIEGVAAVAASASPHPRADAAGPTVDVSGLAVGVGQPAVWACGPCCVESEGQVRELAARLAAGGVQLLRGGAWKPRTSPYAFAGHGLPALAWLRRAADDSGLRVVTEALSEAEAPRVAELADLVQVGSRNMQNFALLRAVGRTRRPVLLKRGMAATVEEWLLAGEHLLEHGAAGVIYCERGVRGFDPATRNLLDLGAVALLAHVHRLPVLVDPSHATGRRDLVAPLARAALAAGAAGLMIETHARPGEARSDGPQALVPDALLALMAGGAR